ncbi:MAG TPA: hypothetical protein VFX49_18175, partial [Chloroflexota bacterium]|nr:hypothetical protein [Chloroflexota bacterium]
RGLWAHAWVELAGSLVFDGVRQEFYDREGYRRALHAVSEMSYDAPAMLERMRASGRYGPWHTGLLGDVPSRRHAVPAPAAPATLASLVDSPALVTRPASSPPPPSPRR